MKKYFFIAGIIVLVGVAFYAGRLNLFQGKLVFFDQAPSSQKVVSAAFVDYYDAVTILMDASMKAGKLTPAEKEELTKKYGAVSNHKVTRSEFATLAREIFKIEEYGFGPAINDVPSNHPNARDIYLFVSHGGNTFDFAPNNQATREFVEKAAWNLSQRFASQGA